MKEEKEEEEEEVEEEEEEEVEEEEEGFYTQVSPVVTNIDVPEFDGVVRATGNQQSRDLRAQTYV